ncbi:hypothetical protein EVAR_92157_1 [Eumeta japonica]|uniref:Uncharacterized protein n=1 Tax=Eumeta variegata TaxID=151549 RepID=A0A4C1SYL2_EUMVA|nr:hypothetical protein EVAR_92157_1 [Eumeta japonica]
MLPQVPVVRAPSSALSVKGSRVWHVRRATSATRPGWWWDNLTKAEVRTLWRRFKYKVVSEWHTEKILEELEDLPLGNYKIATTTEKRVQKVWSNKQKVIIIVNSSALTYYLESVSSDNALFEFEDSSDLLQWLENCTDPWDTVESHWIRTAGTRLKLVKNTNAPASVYINKYPALKKPTGYILTDEDMHHVLWSFLYDEIRRDMLNGVEVLQVGPVYYADLVSSQANFCSSKTLLLKTMRKVDGYNCQTVQLVLMVPVNSASYKY